MKNDNAKNARSNYWSSERERKKPKRGKDKRRKSKKEKKEILSGTFLVR